MDLTATQPGDQPAAAPDQAGRYRLERRLGSGAMGEVWLGRHLDTGGLAAIKRIKARAGSRQRLRAFFARERRAIARLSHPHIVSLFEVGDDYLAYAYIDGADLARRLATPVDPAAAVHIALQIASALAHAHERGVVHRDVKPSNILLDRRGNAFLADFGLADIAGDAEELRGGTPGFMAPEQARTGSVGPTADQFALARTLLEVLAGGKVPEDTAAALAALPPGLPAPLCAALERATRPAAEERFPDIAAFAAALAAVDLSGHAPTARLAPELRVRTPFRWCTAPAQREAIAHDIARVDYRLSDLEAAGLLPAEGVAALRAASGYADLGWSLYGHEGRLGRLDEPAALARAGEVVVLLHGWMCTRRAWRHAAPALCRDNAQAIVLVPDVSGFGESRFAANTPEWAHTTPPALVDTVLGWLALLGVRDLPTVLLGHSMSAMHLMAARGADLGPRTARIALTPVYPFLDGTYRRQVRASAVAFRLFSVVPGLKNLLFRTAITRATATRQLTEDELATMIEQSRKTATGVLARVAKGIISTPVARGADLADCLIVIGTQDPLNADDMVARAIEYLQVPATNIHRMATGGHFPHLESAENPEHTARNIAELVALIDDLLITCRQGTMASTAVAGDSAASADTEVSTEPGSGRSG